MEGREGEGREMRVGEGIEGREGKEGTFIIHMCICEHAR